MVVAFDDALMTTGAATQAAASTPNVKMPPRRLLEASMLRARLPELKLS